MYAIIKTGGKQYKVKPGDTFDVESIDAEIDSTVTFSEVLAVADDNSGLKVGSPLVAGATVEAKVVNQFRGKKLIAFKMKRRKGYRRKKGHRQELTRITILSINTG